MTIRASRALVAGGVLLSLAAGCVQFEDEDGETADAVADVTDTGADDTGTPDVADAGGDGSGAGDAGEDTGPVGPVNLNSTPYEAPGACGAETAVTTPIEITGCGYSFEPPEWQATSLFGGAGLLDLNESCGAAGAQPQHVHLTYPQVDAAQGVAVLWMTDYDTRTSDLRLGTSPENLDRWARGFNFSYTLIDGERRVHEVHLCTLEPSTTYYYQVGGEGAWSEVYSFTTAPEYLSDEPFTFAATGDSRSTTQAIWGQTLDAIETHGADMLVFTGDAVDTGTLQFQWDAWWSQGSATDTTFRLASLPMLYAHGNHDLVGDAMWAMMAYPFDEQSYYVRYGNTLFITLDDSGTFRTGKQIEGEIRDFLEEALEAHPDVTWRIVSHHKPIYSASTNHGSTLELQENWMPLYEEYGVDLVLNGHDHNYERSCRVRAGRCQSGNAPGTTYMVAAGIGAPLYNNGTDWWTETSFKVPSYVIFEVYPDRIEGVSYDPTTGAQIDSFTIPKL